MKTAKIIFAALATAALALSCTREAEVSDAISTGQEITITATMEDGSRTAVQDGGAAVYWEPGDEVKLFLDGAGSRFVSNNTELSVLAKFSGTLNAVFGFYEGFPEDNPLWGLYPYRADATSDGTSVTTTLPAEQTGRAGSFAKNTHITLGRSTSYTMGFYSVCGGLRFSLTQEGIKKVTFEGNNGEALAGTIKMAFVDGLPAIQELTNPQTKLTLTAPGDGTFQTGVYYYIEAIPGTLSGGYKMTFYKEDESAERCSESSITIKRRVFGSISDADEGLIFKPTGGGGDDPDPEDIISFADPIAKYACVDKFDTNGDGEVSYAEAAAATSLNGLFTEWNTVTSFEEIRFFTGVTSTANVFTGLAQLDSITIPAQITTLGTFENCTALKKVVLPDELTAIPNNCFRGCASLSSVELPVATTTIPNNCFKNCKELASLTIPASITSIGNNAFEGCSSLNGLLLPENLGSIGTSAFQDCMSLVTMALPAGITSLATRIFRGCTALTTISWPTNLQTIGDYAFNGCYFDNNDYTLELPASVTSIGSYVFVGLRHLLIPSTSTVSISNKAFGDPAVYCTYLYVPAGKVEIYKIRSNWSEYAERIRPMADYPIASRDWNRGIIGEPVDLGLSVKWASWNVGASAPEEYGEYFAWGETEPKVWGAGNYSWSSYRWCKGSAYSMTKYSYDPSNGYNGFTDNKYALDPEDDAAIANWGDSWRMPTRAEQDELGSECTESWTTLNGVYGRKFTSKKSGYTSKWIFLPAAGRRDGTSLRDAGSNGCYWSSSISMTYSHNASHVGVSSYGAGTSNSDRYQGFSIRPVYCE